METGDGWNTYDAPLAVWVFVRKVEGDGEDVDVGKRFREPSTPVFDVGPVCRRERQRAVSTTAKGT